MTKVLVFNVNVGYGQKRTLVWDISNKYVRDLAYIDLFKILDSELGAYEKADSVICALVPLARNGNPEACEALLSYRRNRYGESFEEVEVRRGVGQPVVIDKYPVVPSAVDISVEDI